MTLSDRLRRLLAARSLSLQEAGRRIGMPRQQLWRIVSGMVLNPGILTVERIVEGIGATMQELYAIRGEESAEEDDPSGARPAVTDPPGTAPRAPARGSARRPAPAHGPSSAAGGPPNRGSTA